MASLPAALTGLVTDDYGIEPAVAHNPWSAFVFGSTDPEMRHARAVAERALGMRPWWMDLDHYQAFLRPLASLWHAMDFKFWPGAAWLMHVENSLMFALAVLLAGAIFRQLELPARVLGCATFFYIWNGHQAVAVSWIASRNTVSCTAFGLLAIWLQLRADRAERPGARSGLTLAAAAALGFGLLHGEFACGALGFVLASALVLQDGPLAKRFMALWPHAIVFGAWLTVHISGGYGASGSGFYHGPAQEPGAFILGVLTGLPIYLATVLTLPIASAACLFPGALAFLTALSLVTLFLLRRLLWPLLRNDRRAKYFALGSALATIPLGATVPQDRLVFFVALGISGLVAMVLGDRFDSVDLTRPRGGERWLFRIHAFYGPLLFVPMLFSNAMSGAVGGGQRALVQAIPAAGERGVVLLNAPSDLPLYHQNQIRRRAGQPELPWIYLLYAGGQPVDVTRSSDRSLELDVEAGYMAALIERITRNPAHAPMHAGDIVELPNMQVTVLAVNSDGAPTRVRAEFPDALEKLAADWFYWEGRAPKPWPLPPVGGRVSLAAIRSFP